MEEKLEEREREITKLMRRRVGWEVDDVTLEEEMERLRDIVEERRGEDAFLGSASSGGALKRRVEELEGDKEDLRAKLDEQAETITQREEEKNYLTDEIEVLRLHIEELHRRRETESFERSQSRVKILEEREEGEAVGDGLNSLTSWLELRLSYSGGRLRLR